jgi:DME family drug/metabolite transporter
MAVIIAGVAVMAAPLGSSVDPIGVLSGILSALTFAVFLFVLARNGRVSAARAFPLGLVGAALLVLVTDPQAVSTLGAGQPPLLILAIGASQAGWALLVGAGLGATNAVTAAMMVAVEPVLISLLALAILDEGLSARAIAGGAIVVAALVAVALRLRVVGHVPAA